MSVIAMRDAGVELGPFADVFEASGPDLSRLVTRRTFGAGQYLFHKGWEAGEVFVIQSGLVALEVPADGERWLTLALLGPEEVLGEMALAGVPRRTASVVAMSDVTVAVLDVRKLRELRELRAGAVDEAVMGVLADSVRQLTQQVLEATLLTLPVRLRRVLLRLNRHYDDGRIRLKHEQLAALLGAQRTTITQLLAADTAAGRIATGRGYVEILDFAALRAAAELTVGAPAASAAA